jgi:hypothetical protein
MELSSIFGKCVKMGVLCANLYYAHWLDGKMQRSYGTLFNILVSINSHWLNRDQPVYVLGLAIQSTKKDSFVSEYLCVKLNSWQVVADGFVQY